MSHAARHTLQGSRQITTLLTLGCEHTTLRRTRDARRMDAARNDPRVGKFLNRLIFVGRRFGFHGKTSSTTTPCPNKFFFFFFFFLYNTRCVEESWWQIGYDWESGWCVGRGRTVCSEQDTRHFPAERLHRQVPRPQFLPSLTAFEQPCTLPPRATY